MNRYVGFLVMLVVVFAYVTPASANLFGIKHVEPTPPPRGRWNFTSEPFKAFTKPDFDGVSVVAQCRYVAPKLPYVWRFNYKNLESNPLSFDMALVQINNGRFATVAQIYTDVERASIRHVTLKPHGSANAEEPGRYGCPGMEGGIDKSKHYTVILDNVYEGKTLARSGVFTDYDTAVDEAHRGYNEAVGNAMAGGASAGFDMINNVIQEQVPTQPAGE